ncbi:MAG: integrase core domain-containing protein, partial [Candidatus Omnitrophica bacterium]|nr:integrase core domain-containing protein [Candidatus Omnitrophota bacterium]
EILNEKLKEWEKFYNYHRPHTSLSGKTPYEKLTSINLTTDWQTYNLNRNYACQKDIRIARWKIYMQSSAMREKSDNYTSDQYF